jgi:hypothetical protein
MGYILCTPGSLAFVGSSGRDKRVGREIWTSRKKLGDMLGSKLGEHGEGTTPTPDPSSNKQINVINVMMVATTGTFPYPDEYSQLNLPFICIILTITRFQSEDQMLMCIPLAQQVPTSKGHAD